MRQNSPENILLAHVQQAEDGKYKKRNQIAVIIAALFQLRAKEIANLTLEGLVGLIKTLPSGHKLTIPLVELVKAHAVHHQIKRDDLFFNSKKTFGNKPVHRITVWRIIKTICGAGLRYLRALKETMEGLISQFLEPEDFLAPAYAVTAKTKYMTPDELHDVIMQDLFGD